MKGTLFINEKMVGEVMDISIKDPNKQITIKESIKFNTIKINYNTFKILFKLPRKKKKKILGLRKARNKIAKRIKLGLPIKIKDFNRAGMEICYKGYK